MKVKDVVIFVLHVCYSKPGFKMNPFGVLTINVPSNFLKFVCALNSFVQHFTIFTS